MRGKKQSRRLMDALFNAAVPEDPLDTSADGVRAFPGEIEEFCRERFGWDLVTVEARLVKDDVTGWGFQLPDKSKLFWWAYGDGWRWEVKE